MILRGLDIYLLEGGHWERCLFCRRVLPTEEHVTNLLKQKLGGFTRDTITIDESGYCNDLSEDKSQVNYHGHKARGFKPGSLSR